ncbi:hypothetical protein ACJ72_01448 [Emergomyces africanus]|uniref:Uncharacterized protein n=1 Tax=Emergomyces africanus TaxID=1955775 RepID=A0A1B7P589_9EURO|nr:hypothetical protein ACJ72_01448 [Emergomyces africanus]
MAGIVLRTRNPSSYAIPDIPLRSSDADISEHEEDIIAGQYFPQPDASDDGTYNTEDDDLFHSDKSNAQEENQNTDGEEDYNSSGDSPALDRLNRYLGPPSTWRAKTRQERHDINSLDTLRARDLSSHLFNAFALKRRAMAIKAQNPEQGQEQQSNTESDADPSSQFVPTKQWTAWPLPADEVPRGDANVPTDGTDIWNIISGPSDERPSAELEECLMAQMLKTAKERFESRSWESQRSRVRKRIKETTSGTDAGARSTDVGESGDDIDIQPAPQFRPVIQADDEKSRSILRPTARHILSDLDNILMSLHHTRQAYVSTVDLSQSEYETDPEEGLTSRSVSRSRATSRTRRSRPRGIISSRNSSMTGDPATISDQERNTELSVPNVRSRSLKASRTRSNTPGRSRSRSPGSRQSKLGLREWTDILGIASISGWPTSVVLRTAKRCSDLFGEDMAFRTLTEGKLELKEGDGSIMPSWEYVEEEVESGESDTDTEIAKPTKDARRRGRDRTGVIYCSVKGCSRSTKGFSRTWNLNQHIKNRHPSLELRGRRSKSTLPNEESS